MKITETETLYSKKGRRYVPAYSLAHWNYDGDMMPVGSFRLVHAYCDGGRRYAYDVTPDTAAWVAAATLAVHAMTEAIHKANQHTIASGTPWTKKQQAAIAQANAILESAGIWGRRGWTTAAAHDVAQAGIDAVRQWANKPTPNAAGGASVLTDGLGGTVTAMTVYEQQQGRELDAVEQHVFRAAYAMGVLNNQSHNA